MSGCARLPPGAAVPAMCREEAQAVNGANSPHTGHPHESPEIRSGWRDSRILGRAAGGVAAVEAFGFGGGKGENRAAQKLPIFRNGAAFKSRRTRLKHAMMHVFNVRVADCVFAQVSLTLFWRGWSVSVLMCIKPDIRPVFLNANCAKNTISEFWEMSRFRLKTDLFGEESVQIETRPLRHESKPTSSLHALRVGEEQTFHVHIAPHEVLGRVVTLDRLAHASSRRLLFVVTGEREGLVQILRPAGDLHVSSKAPAVVTCEISWGCASVIPPWSAVIVEMAGEVHRFSNITAWSYHPLNWPQIDKNLDALAGNTVEWTGSMPQGFQPSLANDPILEIGCEEDVEMVIAAAELTMKDLVNLGPQIHLSPDLPIVTQFLELLFRHGNFR